MKAKRIKPTDSAGWTQQPSPVVDGPHRIKWKDSSTSGVLKQGVPGVSCAGPRHEEDIDANGCYSNALRELEG